MSELRTYYGPIFTNPDPGKEYHYGCRGEVLTFKDGEPTCTKCGATSDPGEEIINANLTHDGKPISDDATCDHGVLLLAECNECWELNRKEAVDKLANAIGIPREVLAEPQDYKCDGTHWLRNGRVEAVGRGEVSLGDLFLEICADMKCADVRATCQHSKTTWNEDGSVLTCNLCGVDGT